MVCLWLVFGGALPAYAEGPGAGSGSVLNIIFLGLIAYFLVRMFRRRMGGDNDDRPGRRPGDGEDKSEMGKVVRPMDRHEAARQMWGHLASKDNEPSTPTGTPANGDFDEAEFLEGAKMFFARFQQVATVEEVDELRGFLSDEVYEKALTKAREGLEPKEIMLLTARVVELKSEGQRTFATVFYDAQMRGGAGRQTEHVRAAWEFSRDDTVDNSLWTLDRINKVDQ